MLHYVLEIGVKEIGVKDPVTPNLSSDSQNPSMLQQVATSQLIGDN